MLPIRIFLVFVNICKNLFWEFEGKLSNNQNRCGQGIAVQSIQWRTKQLSCSSFPYWRITSGCGPVSFAGYHWDFPWTLLLDRCLKKTLRSEYDSGVHLYLELHVDFLCKLSRLSSVTRRMTCTLIAGSTIQPLTRWNITFSFRYKQATMKR